MSPPNTGGSGPPSGIPRSKKVSDGAGYPAVGGSAGDGGGKKPPQDPNECRIDDIAEKPIPVVFTQKTFTKLIAWTLGPLLLTLVGSISAFFYFYHKTNVHLTDPTIHLIRGERLIFETKQEAKVERKRLKSEITGHFDVKVREIKVEQKEQFHKLGTKLRRQQTNQLMKILTEVKKARRDIKEK
jgi:hypothetical protein